MHSGSAHVSTDDQHTALQRAVLQRAGCMTICMDEGLADATVPRSALTRCFAALRSTWPPVCAAPACLGGVTRGAWRTWAEVREHGRGWPRPSTAGQESWAGTATPPERAMPLSQGHNRQSRSPAELTHRYCLCAARVFQGDCHERAPWYTAHPPVSTPLSPATIAVNHDPAWRDTRRLL